MIVNIRLIQQQLPAMQEGMEIQECCSQSNKWISCSRCSPSSLLVSPAKAVGSQKMIGKTEMCDGLYLLKGYKKNEREGHSPSTAYVSTSISIEDQVMLWHFRLGHPSFKYLERLYPHLFANKKPSSYQCEICQLAKHTRSIYAGVQYKPTKPFSIIHSDIWGPNRVSTLNGHRWFIIFIDDHTRNTWTYLMKEKSEAATIFQNFHNMILTQFQTEIQVLHSDNGREYFNSTLGSYLRKHGIIQTSSCIDTPQQNGIAERKNRHLLEVARALMFTSHTPKYLWGDAVLTATYIINRNPSRILNYQTPRSIIQTQYPHLHAINSDLSLRIFGCTAFVHVASQHRTKLDPRSLKCVFIGYSPSQKGYKCYSPTTRKVYHTMDVTFFENQPYYSQPELQGENSRESQLWNIFPDSIMAVIDSGCENKTEANEPGGSMSKDTPPIIQVYQRRKKNPEEGENITHTQSSQSPETGPTAETEPQGIETVPSPDLINDLDAPIAHRKGVRSCTTKHPISNWVSYKKLSGGYKGFIGNLDNIEVPETIQQALQHPEWKKAVEEEIKALEKNNTWTVTSLPSGKRPVDCKWIFTVKYKADGNVERFKARLVAKGFTQSYGIDYQETFAPVAKLNTVRVLLSLAVNFDWPLHQLDVKNAFLNGDIAEEVYMSIPPGMNVGTKESVCKLHKALYGLKQSPRAWFDRFTGAVKASGYNQSLADHTMFMKHGNEGRLAILIVYVDDIIITGDDIEEIRKLKLKLATEFEIKDLGELRYFLGMEVARSKRGLVISQRKYILDLLKETGMLGCKPIDTPMETNKKFSLDENSVPVNRGRYQRLVGKLIYLAHTRPDIAFSVSIVSQHMHSPTEEHMEAVIRILRYLKTTPGQGLLFQKSHKRNIEVYTDASWASELTERRSTTGYCSYVFGNLVTWRSKKQNVVSRSSAESEYRSLAQGICEGIWLKRVLQDLKMENKSAIHVYCDSQSAISIAKNPVHHDRTKHIEIDRHFIAEKVHHGTVDLNYIHTKQQTADLLTKALPKDMFDVLVSKLGLY
ncbi:Retrovirus-related Pol polyprotein from transposon TNT 1-94, partial [Linum perenne]